MEPKKETQKKPLLDRIIGKLLAFSFAFNWLMIVFKFFNIGFMQHLSWWAITWPMFFFVISSLGFLIITMCYIKWFKVKPRQFTEAEIQLQKRRGHLHKKPTRIKDMLVKLIAWLVSAIAAYHIINLWQ